MINLSSKSEQFNNTTLQIGERRQIPLLAHAHQRYALEGLQHRFSSRAGGRLFGSPLVSPAICSLLLANSLRALYSINPNTLNPISRHPHKSSQPTRSSSDKSASATMGVPSIEGTLAR